MEQMKALKEMDEHVYEIEDAAPRFCDTLHHADTRPANLDIINVTLSV